MNNRTSSRINKEKLVFSGVAFLLAGCFYYLMTSRPAGLKPGTMISPLSPPAPVAAEKPANRIASVAGLLNAAGRANPFQPVIKKTDIAQPEKPDIPGGGHVSWPNPNPVPIPPPQPGGGGPNPPPGHNPSEIHDPPPAAVAFSAFMTMDGQTYGHVKTKDGRTIQVQVGDYLDQFKYTITKIEKQAIWVTDERERVFVARDMTFADGSTSHR
ncbi:MAG TPA: hypothetical protein VKX17_20225 [Planctomycetota bacterium]|nr:hypothetical protein [Planctomycetota bacterium]